MFDRARRLGRTEDDMARPELAAVRVWRRVRAPGHEPPRG
jgi:hypothetical protein